MDKKKLFAIVLFFLMGFFMFTNANPSDGTKKIKEEQIDDTSSTKQTKKEQIDDTKQNTEPIITLNGGNIVIRQSNFNYKELGATAIDKEDGNISDKIVITGKVENKKGIYNINYDVTDSEGLTAKTVTREVDVVDIKDLEAAINNGKKNINETTKKEISKELKKLLEKLNEDIKDGEKIIENKNSKQTTIDEKEKEIKKILDQINNLTFEVSFYIGDELVTKTTVKYNESVSDDFINLISTSKEGYTFSGWNGNYKNVMKNEKIKGTNTLINYELTYILDNKIVSKTKFNAENNINLTKYDKKGYNCSSWYENDTEILTTNKIYRNITVSATCEATNTDYKVIVKKQNINNDDYTSNEYILKGITDSKIDIESLKSTYLEEGFTYFNHTKNSEFVSATNQTIITLIYNRNLYDLSYKNGNEIIGSIKYKYGTEINLTKTVSKNGYTFTGWNLNNEIVTKVTMNTNIELKATFDIIEYNITYINDGNQVENKTTYTIEDQFDFISPTKEGYNFIGWYYDNIKVDGISLGSVGDLTLTAVYEIQKFNVSFYNENELINNQKIEYGKSAIAPINPTKENYTFIGWDKEFSNVKSDLNIYALYKANQIGIQVLLKPNAQLQFKKNSNVDLKNYIDVYKVYADNTKELTTDYTTNLSTNKVVDHEKLIITQDKFTNNELEYSVINEDAYQTKFEINYKQNGYRETWNGLCISNCSSNFNTNFVKTDYSLLEIIEHYDEFIEINSVTAYYGDEKKDLVISDSVRWTHLGSRKGILNVVYNPVYIATLEETYTEEVCKPFRGCQNVQKTKKVDVMNDNKIITKLEIKYNRKFSNGTKKYVVVFSLSNGIFTAIDEYEI